MRGSSVRSARDRSKETSPPTRPAGTHLETERCVIVGGAPAGAAEMGLRNLLDRVVRRRAKLVPEERLRFETLLSELSAGLIHVAAGDIDAALERGLQQVVTFLGVDRGNLDAYVGGEPGVRISWARPGMEAMPRRSWTPASSPGRPRGCGAGTGRPILPDRRASGGGGDRSGQLRARGHALEGLRSRCAPVGPCSACSPSAPFVRERAWPDELVERLRLLSAAFASALERKRMELSLAERLRFEKLLSSLSAAFSHLSAADFDREVQRGLRQVVDFLGVDRGSLIEFSRDGRHRAFVGDRGMDGRGRVPVDDGPAANAATSSALRSSKSFRTRRPWIGGAISRTASSPRSRCRCWWAASSWEGSCSARSAPSARGRTS